MPTSPDLVDIVTPIIHLNGDRRETLLTHLEEAYCAVSAALETLRQCAPNGRNDYPDPGRLGRAEAQHRARQAHREAVRESLEAEAIQLQEETRA